VFQILEGVVEDHEGPAVQRGQGGRQLRVQRLQPRLQTGEIGGIPVGVGGIMTLQSGRRDARDRQGVTRVQPDMAVPRSVFLRRFRGVLVALPVGTAAHRQPLHAIGFQQGDHLRPARQ
jgi:hypothetical protein